MTAPSTEVNEDLVVVRIPGKGRGVVAGRRFEKGELITRDPVILIPPEDWAVVQETVLVDYTFIWHDQDEDAAVALGLGSLVNHSYSPNAISQKRMRARVIEFMALRDIEAGEEITLNYHGDPESREALHFEVKD